VSKTRPLTTSGYEPRHSLKWVKIRKYFSLELMVQIKQKRVYRVENLLPKSFLGGVTPTYLCSLSRKGVNESISQ